MAVPKAWFSRAHFDAHLFLFDLARSMGLGQLSNLLLMTYKLKSKLGLFTLVSGLCILDFIAF